MRQLVLRSALGIFCLAGLSGCHTRPTQPMTVSQRFQDLKRLPPRPKDVMPHPPTTKP
jgi:hypothetical protein